MTLNVKVYPQEHKRSVRNKRLMSYVLPRWIKMSDLIKPKERFQTDSHLAFFQTLLIIPQLSTLINSIRSSDTIPIFPIQTFLIFPWISHLFPFWPPPKSPLYWYIHQIIRFSLQPAPLSGLPSPPFAISASLKSRLAIYNSLPCNWVIYTWDWSLLVCGLLEDRNYVGF